MTTLDDFKIIEKLGDGAYSTVFKVKRNEDGLCDIGIDLKSARYSVYALKKVNIFNLSEKERENALNEVRILAS